VTRLVLQGVSLTDEPSSLLTVPVIPMVDSVAKYVLILKECEAVLAVPVIGFIPHPVIPLNLPTTVGLLGPFVRVVM